MFIGCLALAFGLAACGGSTPAASHKTHHAASSAPPTPTTDLEAVASSAYEGAYNTMQSGLNADVAGQNSSDPTTSENAINDEVTVLQAFDSAVENIQFPAEDQSDAQTVLNDDAAWENGLGTLAVNTDNTDNYNQVFDTVQPEQTAAQAAQVALARDLGLSSSGS
jgi:hypothetical protein